jgi:hypothetical protein
MITNKIVSRLVAALIGSFGRDMLVVFLELFLEFAEKHVKESETKIDDTVVLPLLEILQNILNEERKGTDS